MEVSSMAYDSCVKTYNASSQNSLSNSDKDSNTPSSIIYSAASCTLLNHQNVPSSNDKIMEAHKSTHNTLNTQNAFKDNSTVYPLDSDSSCTFSNGQGFANTNNVTNQHYQQYTILINQSMIEILRRRL